MQKQSLGSYITYSRAIFEVSFQPSEGVEPVGNVVMKKAVFTVETISAGMGEVLVYVEDPAGHREEVGLNCLVTVFVKMS